MDLAARRVRRPPTVSAETLLGRLADHVQDILYRYRLHPTRGFEYVSAAATRVTGYTPQEHYADPDLGRKLVHPDDLPLLEAYVREERFERPLTLRWRRKDGAVIWTEQRNVPVRNRRGRLVALDGIARDVTERRQAEFAIAASERRLRAVIEHEPECVKILDRAGHVLEMNPAGLAMVEAESAADVVGRDISVLVHAEHRAAFRALVDDGFAGRSGMLQFAITGFRGTVRWLETRTAPLRDEEGRITGLLGVTREVTERRRAEEALRRSEERYRSLVKGAAYGIYRSTVDGHFVEVNPALVKMLGYDSEADLLAVDVLRDVYREPAERHRLIEQYKDGGQITGVEVEWKRKDGSPVTVRLSGRPTFDPAGALEGFEMIVEDVTARRLLEDQLRQSQKMEAIGRLAGGVAHDFNNILTAITGYAELLLADLPQSDARRADVTEIRRAADRASALTRQLLAFSRRQVLQTRVLDLTEVVQGMEKMLRRIIGEDIELDTELAANGRVRADPSQLEQVILNLAVNSRDAMPRGGRLAIRTRDVELAEPTARERALMPSGRYVVLQVTDTGMGMDSETQAHAFEPFFTTKEQGKGTGLGLATVYGIVKQSDGYVWLTSAPGHGTTFEIYLPAVDETAEHPVPRPETPDVRGGNEVVLLVEDDAAVASLARSVLERYGYRVLHAEHPDAALELARRHEGPLHLLLTDVIMPGMSGHDLRERLMQSRPGIPVVYMSGYAGEAGLQGRLLEDGAPFIPKPFTPQVLVLRVREALDAAAAGASARPA
jgi:PAS domain S-box-containing protein